MLSTPHLPLLSILNPARDPAVELIFSPQVVAEFKKLNPNVPMDPREQLRGAVLAVFKSWNNDRAIRYRSYNGIPDKWGTAVSVQAMAYGNMNDGCGTGVAFSRNPSTGENKFFGGEIEMLERKR